MSPTPTFSRMSRSTEKKYSNIFVSHVLLAFFFQLIAIICMSLVSPAYNGSSHFFLFVCVINFIATVLWSFIYLLGIREVLVLPIDWYLTVSWLKL